MRLSQKGKNLQQVGQIFIYYYRISLAIRRGFFPTEITPKICTRLISKAVYSASEKIKEKSFCWNMDIFIFKCGIHECDFSCVQLS